MKTYFARGVLALLWYLVCSLMTFGAMKDADVSPAGVWFASLLVALVVAFFFRCFIWLIDNA